MGLRLTRREVLCGATAALCLAGPARAWQQHRLQLFGGPVRLQLPPSAPVAAVREVLAGLHRLHVRWNAWKPGGLAGLNEALREGRSQTVEPALRKVLLGAAHLERLSGGHFNAAIGGLVGAWGFHAEDLVPGTLPAEALRGWQGPAPSLASLAWDGERVRSWDRRVQIDLGAYAKGVALDWALDRLQFAGVHDAMLDLGGNLAVRGGNDGRAWTIGIRDPAGAGLLAVVPVRGRQAVVTSGGYERWRMLGGQRFGHVMDPATGRPAGALASATVLHADAALADAAATALLVAGPSRWAGVAQRMGVRDALVVEADGRLRATPWLAPRLALL